VFLDRDGVINALVARDGRMLSPRLLDEFTIIPGVQQAIEKLKWMGFEVVVATNQPDISRGFLEPSVLQKMNSKVSELGVNRVCVCIHSDGDSCECRKPKPGMLVQYIKSSKKNYSSIWMIGDQETDVIAGALVGAVTILISNDNRPNLATNARYVVANLVSAVEVITEVTFNDQSMIFAKDPTQI
jgi:D-glycero-D-manno-heptose 1,7-bisphosphate phosphatase